MEDVVALRECEGKSRRRKRMKRTVGDLEQGTYDHSSRCELKKGGQEAFEVI
jgi:hypothetical protein